MPTVLRIKGLRFYFYSGEHQPPHVHVIYGEGKSASKAKVIIETQQILKLSGFSRKDERTIKKIVANYKEFLLDAWEDYFNEQ